MGKEGRKLGRIAPPKGTRDLYPEDALKRRYLEQSWRDASIRCGFEEIHGPTFETTDLYAVKSGEGILGELFQAFSGKSDAEVEQVKASGRAPFAMRPEFTPTLARMYAARANGLPSPCKWFTGGSYFRAERPQRGRLREFLQWNVDVIGLPGDGEAEAKAQMDAETVGVGISLCRDVGLGLDDVAVHHSDRDHIAEALTESGISESGLEGALALLDKSAKLERGAFETQASALGMNLEQYEQAVGRGSTAERLVSALAPEDGEWCRWDASVVRGLAYYTGTVFEVLADGERAVAGGGRYDKLIELMGGPSTPAVGFAMGDVVVSLLLEEKGLMPQGPELMDAVSRRPASVRPEVFVVGADDEASDPLVRRLCADLRRGVESERYEESDERKPWSAARYDAETGGVRPMHARVSYKSARNLKKLLGDAEKQQARLVAVVHGEDRVQLKDLDTRQDLTPKDVGLSDSAAEFSVDPQSPVSIGRAAACVLG